MDSPVPHARTNRAALRRVVRLAALLNLGYFGVEFAVALAVGSVSLFADSIDFLHSIASHTARLPGQALEQARQRHATEGRS
jgi:Co/Zn/Cd efflux system component